MKRTLAVLLILLMCSVLIACDRSDVESISYTSDLCTDAFYIIGFSNSEITDAPMIVSHKKNAGDVYICIVDDNGIPVGEKKIISPGQTVVLDASAITGSYTIQGKAIDTSGVYTFETRWNLPKRY